MNGVSLVVFYTCFLLLSSAYSKFIYIHEYLPMYCEEGSKEVEYELGMAYLEKVKNIRK